MDEKALLKLLKNSSHKIIGDDASISIIGAGENFVSFLAKNSDGKNVIRVAKRGNKKIVEEEFKWLEFLPDGIGPRAVRIDVSQKIIPYPYMIQTFIEGKQVNNWGDAELVALARAMASFHKVKSHNFGSLKSVTKTLVLVDFLNDLNSYFFDRNKSLLYDEDIKKIRPNVLKYLESNQHLFDSISSFSLIHGDMTNQNMLFDGEKMHIVDWETASYGDNALDFATFYYDDFPYHKWRVHLSLDKANTLVNAYKKDFPDPTLEERIKVWLVFDKFCSLLYCKWKMDEYQINPDEKVTITTNELKQEIEKIKKSFLKD